MPDRPQDKPNPYGDRPLNTTSITGELLEQMQALESQLLNSASITELAKGVTPFNLAEEENFRQPQKTQSSSVQINDRQDNIRFKASQYIGPEDQKSPP